MQKGTHRSREEYREEYQDDSHSRAFKKKRRGGRDSDDSGPHKSTAGYSEWVFGNLFECLSDNEHCAHGRVPFGGSFYCAWPLKNTSADFHIKPPCLWDRK